MLKACAGRDVNNQVTFHGHILVSDTLTRDDGLIHLHNNDC